jgi:hypothetical protein
MARQAAFQTESHFSRKIPQFAGTI